MGLVIKAHNLDLDERVAIKILREDIQIDDDTVTRFVREAKAAVKLKSEHIARIRDVGTFEDGRPYMVMELLEGLDLGRILLDHGKLEPHRAVDLVLQACDAIAEAHSLGIVHRDIKPTNLFVARRRDGTELLKVLDFGISKATMGGPEMSLTQTSSMLGTPAYMSPEQMRSARTVDYRSDIWSLGTVLYELVEGRQPFEASNFAELCVMVSIEEPSPMVVAPELFGVVGRALAKQLEQRYQNVADFAIELEQFATDPQLARRQVAKIYRTLGKTAPNGRDSTPIPMQRRPSGERVSASVIPRTTPFPATPNPFAPTPTVTIERRSSPWKMVALFIALMGIGVAAGVFVMNTSNEEPAAPDPNAAPASVPPEQVVPQPAGSAVTIEREDAGTREEGSAATTATKPAPQPAKPPTRKPTPTIRKPALATKPATTKPATTKPAATKPAVTTKPATPPKPVPDCDPFANPNGCK